ncbi:hypothetical protein ACE6H2_017367 [Prunus campanulata]
MNYCMGIYTLPRHNFAIVLFRYIQIGSAFSFYAIFSVLVVYNFSTSELIQSSFFFESDGLPT